jgi:RimJ/RimL family protein N-acetyltransferase
MGIALRNAGELDAMDLLAWRNDPQTRAASFNTDPVPEDDHRQWLTACLADPDWWIWVATFDGEKVGTVRAHRVDRVAELSITVAPECRGHGYGAEMIRVAVQQMEASGFADRVTAEIKSWNVRSIAAFRRAGFTVAAANTEMSLALPDPCLT